MDERLKVANFLDSLAPLRLNFRAAPWPRQHKGRQERDGEGDEKEKRKKKGAGYGLQGKNNFGFLGNFTTLASKGRLMKKHPLSCGPLNVLTAPDHDWHARLKLG